MRHRPRRERRQRHQSRALLVLVGAVALGALLGVVGARALSLATLPHAEATATETAATTATERPTPALTRPTPRVQPTRTPPPLASATAAPSPTVARATVGRASPSPTARRAPGRVPLASRYNPTPLTPDEALARAVLEALGDEPGTFAVAIKDVDTGRGMLLDADRTFYAASLFKLFVMYEVYHQRALGLLDLDEVLELTERHASYDLGTLSLPPGSHLTVADALWRMITFSDNATAILLQDRVGAWNINQNMKAIGLQGSRLTPELPTTAADVLLFLEMLARGQAVDEATSAAMVHLMLHQQVRDRIPRLLPPGTPVANKTGNWTGMAHDAGIVYGPRSTFVFVALTSDLPDTAAGSAAIARMALAAYEYLNGPGAGPAVETALPPESIPFPPTSTSEEFPATPDATSEEPTDPTATPDAGTEAETDAAEEGDAE